MWYTVKSEQEKVMNFKGTFRLIAFFVIISCASSSSLRLKKHHQRIHPVFESYISEFIHESDGSINREDFKDFTMGFKRYKATEKTVGVCHYSVNEVDIDIDYWQSGVSISQRMELIFHELGHCILRRGHTHTKKDNKFITWLEKIAFKLGIFNKKKHLADGCPASFMHPYVLGEVCINKHFDYYMDELFGRKSDENYVEDYNLTRKRCTVRPRIINPTKKWLDIDRRSFEKAKKDCVLHYNSCLKIFIKKDHLNYHTICGD